MEIHREATKRLQEHAAPRNRRPSLKMLQKARNEMGMTHGFHFFGVYKSFEGIL